MEILEILKKSGKSLYLEDLDFLETELATGGDYDEAYQNQCRKRIEQLRARLDMNARKTLCVYNNRNGKIPSGLFVGVLDLAPKEVNPAADSFTPEKVILNDILAMREARSYKTKFKKYVAGKVEMDAAFVDMYFSFFQPLELDTIISVKQMGEEFLEKYFEAIDHNKIARYQQFSEAFFMKHFSQLDYTIVLEHGVNKWRLKENRSKQLDVFLRLKGVKI